MKFGKRLRASVRPDWPSVDYKGLKGAMHNGPDNFERALNKELRKTSTFFRFKHAQVLSDSSSEADQECQQALRKWQILNYIAVMKLCKKFDKHNPQEPLNAQILRDLVRQPFVAQLAKPPERPDTLAHETCGVCLNVLTSPVALPCSHRFCFACLNLCDEFGHKHCPLCRVSCETLNPINRAIDDVLGGSAEKYHVSRAAATASAPETFRAPLLTALMVLINLLSSAALMSFAFDVVTAHQELAVEAVLLGSKAIVEYLQDSLSRDIQLHHASMCVGLVLVWLPRFAPWAWVVVLMQAVHLPLTVHWARRLLPFKSSSWNALRVAFLLLWLPTCLFRCSVISFEAVSQLRAGRMETGGLLSVFALLFCTLDFMWTPWQKYSSLLTASRSKAMACIDQWCRPLQIGRLIPRC